MPLAALRQLLRLKVVWGEKKLKFYSFSVDFACYIETQYQSEITLYLSRMHTIPPMPSCMERLYDDMTRDLSLQETDLPGTEKCIEIVRKSMLALESLVIKTPFEGPQEEIHFFKHIKPLFYSAFIYFTNVYRISINRPPGNRDIQEKYIQRELARLTDYFVRHREFYLYYRSGATSLDHVYFLHGKESPDALQNPRYQPVASVFTSSHDYLVAKILAHDDLQVYLKKELTLIRDHAEGPGLVSTGNSLRWTASKADLVELIYALQAGGVYNNGHADLRRIAGFFEQSFQVKLGNYYHVFNEIRLRKKNRTQLLDQLREKIIRRMD